MTRIDYRKSKFKSIKGVIKKLVPNIIMRIKRSILSIVFAAVAEWLKAAPC